MTDAPLATAQQDPSRAYAGGAPGVLVSDLVWLITAAPILRRGRERT